MRITTLRWLPIVLQLRAFVCLCMFVCTHKKMTVFIPRYFMTSAKPKKKKISCRFSCLFLWWIFWNLPNVEFLLLLVETVRSATLSGGSKLRTFHHSVFPLNILSVFVIRVNQLKLHKHLNLKWQHGIFREFAHTNKLFYQNCLSWFNHFLLPLSLDLRSRFWF